MKKIVLVTGTSSGLGKAFATSLLKAGFTVVAPYGSQKRLQSLSRFNHNRRLQGFLTLRRNQGALFLRSRRSSARSARSMRSSTMLDTDTKEHLKRVPWTSCGSSLR